MPDLEYRKYIKKELSFLEKFRYFYDDKDLKAETFSFNEMLFHL